MKSFENTHKSALNLINKYHENQRDKGNNSYKEHLFYVSDKCKNTDAKITALLHDILEDTSCTEEVLMENQIPLEVIAAIKLLTKPQELTYNEYIDLIIKSNNRIALEVKFWDLNHNMNLTRLNNLAERDVNRVNKRYKPAQDKIYNKLLEMENSPIL